MISAICCNLFLICSGADWFSAWLFTSSQCLCIDRLVPPSLIYQFACFPLSITLLITLLLFISIAFFCWMLQSADFMFSWTFNPLYIKPCFHFCSLLYVFATFGSLKKWTLRSSAIWKRTKKKKKRNILERMRLCSYFSQ